MLAKLLLAALVRGEQQVLELNVVGELGQGVLHVPPVHPIPVLPRSIVCNTADAHVRPQRGPPGASEGAKPRREGLADIAAPAS
eukprot:CAMPEP_0180377218 /NCGR_PEP_ID=MMETSP0989-20121125/23954_1 /TAXON_ID=697907 /ORGANISM="non described non described, Strain CCMP2293" /LENGTH=83 /DNA_ID=CAMNT_0022375731 /DNA_START=621 /DNA_END=870 /DNA_ORIENTATION=+